MTDAGSVGGREFPRLFVALVLPPDAVRSVVAWQEAAFDDVAEVRIVPPSNLHVTLAFLGQRPAGDIARVAKALGAAAAEAERPVLAARGYRETRAVGMLTLSDEDRHATRLAKDVHRRLARLRVYRPERRPWLPHLTVLRFRQRPRLSPDVPDLGPISPSEAAVYHSVLRPGGAQYEIVESVALGGRQ